jgi:hypothetical protein
MFNCTRNITKTTNCESEYCLCDVNELKIVKSTFDKTWELCCAAHRWRNIRSRQK